MPQRTWTDLHNSLRRIAAISKKAQTADLEYEYRERLQPYPIGHIFYGVTLADPEKGIEASGPSYIDLVFRALVKSPEWKRARVEFAEYIIADCTITEARYRIVCRYCF